MKKTILILILIISSCVGQAQSAPGIHLESLSIPNFPGLQSFSYGVYGDWWFFIGGRGDGLHMRQPFASFDSAGHNTNVYAVNFVTQEILQASVSSLPVNIAEHLRTTNMEFIQRDNTLYLIGGYGISSVAGDHQTFPFLTAVSLPTLLTELQNGTLSTGPFRQVENDTMAVTGGHIHFMNNQYYLVGGHRFDGRYNPMNGPTFTQTYNETVWVFGIEDDGTNLSIEMDTSFTDTAHFHRRDYNLVPQILPSGEECMTIYSGVFKTTADLPFLYPVDITADGYEAHTDLTQRLNHYHCGNVPVYSPSTQSMYTFFLGGMAQYYPGPNGNLVEDQSVPFVTSIARISRTPQQAWVEELMPETMPSYLGGAAEFIPVNNLPYSAEGVINWDALTGDTILVGYLVGGIESTSANIFFVNTGVESDATGVIQKVFLTREDGNPTSIQAMNIGLRNDLFVTLSPVPSNDHVVVTVNITEPGNLTIYAIGVDGKEIARESFDLNETGDYDIKLDLSKAPSGVVNIYGTCGKNTGFGRTIIQRK